MGKRVMIMAGGTGGHVYPALAVADELRGSGHEVIWMGTHKGLEARIVPAAGIPMEWLSVSGIRGKGLIGTLRAPFMLIRALLQSASILRRVRPDVVLGMGGFAAGPGGLVASLMGIPLVLHEQNRIPGTTNKMLSRRADAVLEAFPDSFPSGSGALATGNPLRREISSLSPRAKDRQPGEPVNILIVGGSLGAKALNETVPAALARINLPINIRHQTGQAMRDQTESLYVEAGLKASVMAFVDNMAEAYTWADLAICRSGAMTVSELAATGLPAILVPYPHAIDDHQTQNARFLTDADAAILMPQTELTSESLAALITEILETPHRLSSMSSHAYSISQPAAAEKVAEICLQLASRRNNKNQAEKRS